MRDITEPAWWNIGEKVARNLVNRLGSVYACLLIGAAAGASVTWLVMR